MSAVGVELTAAECAGLSKRLKDATDSKDTKTLKDILDVLNASNAKGKLVNIKAAKLGNPVQKLSYHEDPDIKAAAAELVRKWKALANDKVKPAAGGPAAAAATSAPSPSAPPEATVPKTEPPAATVPKTEPKPEPAEATNEAAGPTPAATASSSSSDHKPGQLVLTGEAIRDSVLQKLHDVFKKGLTTHAAFLRDHDSDPAVMAQARAAPALCAPARLGHAPVCSLCVSGMRGGDVREIGRRFEGVQGSLPDSHVQPTGREGAPQARGEPGLRGLSVHVLAPWQNPDFIQGVLMGMFVVTDLATMDVKEMASGAMKEQRQKYSEYAKMALMDAKSYEKYAGKEVQDGILKCPKCKGMKTEYTEVQTRSADEPTTKKCFCNDCGYRWKCAACLAACLCARVQPSLASPPFPCRQVLLRVCGASFRRLCCWVGKRSEISTYPRSHRREGERERERELGGVGGGELYGAARAQGYACSCVVC